MAKVTEAPKSDAENPFAMLKKKKVKVELTEEEAKAKKDKEDSESQSSSQRKKSKKKKGANGLSLKPVLSNKALELVDNGTVPVEFVKANNEAVSLLHQADDKLKRILEMYVPSRKTSSMKSNASSRRSKSSGKSIKPKTTYTVVPDLPTNQLVVPDGKKEEETSFRDYMEDDKKSNKSVKSGKSVNSAKSGKSAKSPAKTKK